MSNETYNPTTFVERGVAVPFTTPALQYSRVRMTDAGDLDVLIGGFTGDRTIYVLPFGALGENFNMTVHDRALSEDIITNRAVTPHTMKLAAYRVALTGLAGGPARTAARQGLDADKDSELLTQYLLTSKVLELSGLTAQQVAHLIAAGKNDTRIRREIKAAAVKLGIDPEMLNPFIDEISRFSYMVGLPTAPVQGAARRMFTRLKKFDEHLEHFYETSRSDRLDVIIFTRETLALTLGLAEETVAKVDNRLGKIDKELFEVKNIRALKADCERISWLLDGWEDILGLYYGEHPDSKHPPTSHVLRILDSLFIKLPIVPIKEARPDDPPPKPGAIKTRRAVRASEDWRTGDMDLETILRIEQMKARAMSKDTKPKAAARGR